MAALGLAAPAFADDELDGALAVTPPELAADADASAEAGSIANAAETVEASMTEAIEDAAPVVTVTQSAEGDIDVSVRVLSPEPDAQPPDASGETSVVSPDRDGDTTLAPEQGASADSSDGEGANVNVSVRVLSPGSDGEMSQSTATNEGLDGADPTVPSQSDSAAGSETSAEQPSDNDSASPVLMENEEQYHEVDFQYQSESTSDATAWQWLWYLSLDCEGNATSLSSEKGSPSSSTWDWEWNWAWSCNSPPRPPPRAEPQPEEPSSSGEQVSSESADESADVESPGEPDAPWLWTWTFTFCGETITMAAPIDVETTLRWTWEWNWSWTCESAEPVESGDGRAVPTPTAPTAHASASASAGEGQGSGAPGVTGPSQPDVALVLPRLPVISLDPFGHFPALPPFGPMTIDLPAIIVTLEVELAMPTVTVATLLPSAGDAAVETPPATPPIAGDETEAAPVRRVADHASSPIVREELRATSAPKASHARARAKNRSAAPRRGGTPLRPELPPPLRSAGAPGTTAGSVPGGGSVGIAALIGFLFASAVGVMRRIRSARELSPRGIYGSTIDRPG